jgi:hypothetical protein
VTAGQLGYPIAAGGERQKGVEPGHSTPYGTVRHNHPMSTVADIATAVDALTDAAAAQLRSDALGAFLDDWEAKHGELTPDELARATNELTLPP